MCIRVKRGIGRAERAGPQILQMLQAYLKAGHMGAAVHRSRQLRAGKAFGAPIGRARGVIVGAPACCVLMAEYRP